MASAVGIQTLLEAEKEAAKIVAKARQYRVQRLKEARQEAAKEIEALKQQKNAEFINFEKQFSGSSDNAVTKVNKETEEKLVKNNETYLKNKDAVIEKLMKAIQNVEPEVHKNVKIALLEKITYLILIDYYCDNAKSDQTLVISIEQQKSLTNLLLFLHDQVNCTKNLKHFKSLNDILVELNDISNKYTLTEVSLYLLFQLKKCTSSSEEFINLFKRIIDLIENPESSSPNDASVFPTLLIERNSPFGLFLRRCVLDFNNLLLENLVDFQNRFMIPYFKNLNLKLFQNLSREELNNLNSIKFLNNDGEEIEENIIEDVFPKLVVKSEVNPTDEFLVYDDCFKYVEKLVEMLEMPHHYAVLNLAILHDRFNHHKAALLALNEAIDAAIAQDDEECITYASFWKYKIQKSAKKEFSIYNSNSTDLKRLLKTSISKAKVYKLNYLDSLGELSLAKEYFQSGQSPSKVFESLNKSNFLNLFNDIKWIRGTYNLLLSNIWDEYGFSELAMLYANIQIKFYEKESSLDDITLVYCKLAHNKFAQGDIKGALEYLKMGKEKNLSKSPVPHLQLLK
ncbi:anaphase promoting complex subunit 5, partial [Lobulomyces angularis]